MKWVQLCGSLSILWHCLSLGLEWKLTSSSPVVTSEFSKFAGIECRYLTASSFRIWNSSAGIPSPPLALFIVMLPKAHLTLHSRVSGSRWVIIASWLSGSSRCFLYSSSVYSCHLFFTSSTSFRSIPFLSFIVPIFAWNLPMVSLIFLKRSLVFPVLLFSSICVIHLERPSYLSLLFFGSFFFSFVFHFSSQLFERPPRAPFCLFAFLLLGNCLITAPCTVLQTSVHSSSGTLFIRSNPLSLFVTATV